MTGHLSTLPTYNTLLAGDGLCELGPLRISSSMNYASQASTLVLDAPAVHTWPRTSCLLLWLWRKILQAELRNVKSFTRSKSFKPNFTPKKARKSRKI